TTAPESVEGIKVVAEALRSAPRLKSQQGLHLDCLLTRALNERALETSGVDQKLQGVADSIHWLPHDDELAGDETTYLRYFFVEASIQALQAQVGELESFSKERAKGVRLLSDKLRSQRPSKEPEEQGQDDWRIAPIVRLAEMSLAWRESLETVQ